MFENLEGSSASILQQSLISFLSISGYRQNGASSPPKEVRSLVECLQILTGSNYRKTLESLMKRKDNESHFENSLINLSYLMGN